MLSLQTEQEITDLKQEVILLKTSQREKQDAIDQLAALITDLQQQLVDSKQPIPAIASSVIASSTISSSLIGPNIPQTPLTTYAVNMLDKTQNPTAGFATTSGSVSSEHHYGREDELIEHVTYLRQAFCRFVKARDSVEMQVLYV